MFEAEIERGAKWLDKVDPGWELKIDFETLEMAMGCQCILGQVFNPHDEEQFYSGANGYDIGLDLADVANDTYDEGRFAWAVEHGFNLLRFGGDGLQFRDYHTLEEEWTSFVKDRLDKGVRI